MLNITDASDLLKQLIPKLSDLNREELSYLNRQTQKFLPSTSISLNKQLFEHFERVKNIAVEAESDQISTISQRAIAMGTLSKLLRAMTMDQKELINLERLQIIEQALVHTARKHLNRDQLDEFVNEYEDKLKVASGEES